MNILKLTEKGIIIVIGWIEQVWKAFFNMLGINEWVAFVTALGIGMCLIGISFWKNK